MIATIIFYILTIPMRLILTVLAFELTLILFIPVIFSEDSDEDFFNKVINEYKKIWKYKEIK